MQTVCLGCRAILINLGIILTHCPEGHEFTEENTLVTSNYYRQCRRCNRERMRKPRST